MGKPKSSQQGSLKSDDFFLCIQVLTYSGRSHHALVQHDSQTPAEALVGQSTPSQGPGGTRKDSEIHERK